MVRCSLCGPCFAAALQLASTATTSAFDTRSPARLHPATVATAIPTRSARAHRTPSRRVESRLGRGAVAAVKDAGAQPACNSWDGDGRRGWRRCSVGLACSASQRRRALRPRRARTVRRAGATVLRQARGDGPRRRDARARRRAHRGARRGPGLARHGRTRRLRRSGRAGTPASGGGLSGPAAVVCEGLGGEARRRTRAPKARHRPPPALARRRAGHRRKGAGVHPPCGRVQRARTGAL
mmetsp:Transcript_9455/g.30365  ORF Transcript_9455/g.30365 Transcript_9455/m.30365 type:complete len:239 (+) Transcript_9455:53-769(+)